MIENAPPGLVIDWTQMPTYNTIMAIAAGAALISLVRFARALTKDKGADFAAWALGFGVPGLILTITGAHMSLTWPFAKYFPFDNIIFGETSLGFGVLLLAAACYLWFRGAAVAASGDPVRHLASAARPLTPFIVGMGLALFAIAAAGVVFQLFAAPPEEPISGAFAAYPWFEAAVISGMFGAVGLGAVLFPAALDAYSGGATGSPAQRVIGWVWTVVGLGFLLFGALNFYTHIGLIIHTMG